MLGRCSTRDDKEDHLYVSDKHANEKIDPDLETQIRKNTCFTVSSITLIAVSFRVS